MSSFRTALLEILTEMIYSHPLNDYPAILRQNPDSSYTVFMRNWEGAISEGDTLKDAQDAAKALLLDVLDSLYDKGEIIPNSAPAQSGDYLVHLPLDAVLKIMLRNCMVKEKCTKAELARRLDIPPQRINGVLSFYKSTNLATLEKAFNVLNHTLKVSLD